jgi:Fic family protein
LICNENNVKINDSFIRPGVIRKTNIPMEVENRLEDILFKYRSDNKPAIIRAFDMHYSLIELQAFDDYNKRTARMVMNWALLENGYRPVAFTRKTDKESYPEALVAMKKGETKKYYKYMMNAMLSSQNKIISQLKTSKIR